MSAVDVFGNELKEGDEIVILTVSAHVPNLSKGKFLGVHKNGGFRVERTYKSWGWKNSKGERCGWNDPDQKGTGYFDIIRRSTLICNRVIKL